MLARPVQLPICASAVPLNEKFAKLREDAMRKRESQESDVQDQEVTFPFEFKKLYVVTGPGKRMVIGSEHDESSEKFTSLNGLGVMPQSVLDDSEEMKTETHFTCAEGENIILKGKARLFEKKEGTYVERGPVDVFLTNLRLCLIQEGNAHVVLNMRLFREMNPKVVCVRCVRFLAKVGEAKNLAIFALRFKAKEEAEEFVAKQNTIQFT